MILVDTSMWVRNLRTSDPRLVDGLNIGRVADRPLVIDGIACAEIANRSEMLGLLGRLPVVTVVTNAKARGFLEPRTLMEEGPASGCASAGVRRAGGGAGLDEG